MTDDIKHGKGCMRVAGGGATASHPIAEPPAPNATRAAFLLEVADFLEGNPRQLDTRAYRNAMKHRLREYATGVAPNIPATTAIMANALTAMVATAPDAETALEAVGTLAVGIFHKHMDAMPCVMCTFQNYMSEIGSRILSGIVRTTHAALEDGQAGQEPDDNMGSAHKPGHC